MYLNVTDIEGLLSNYIEIQEPEDQPETFTDESSNEVIINGNYQEQVPTTHQETISSADIDLLREDLVQEIQQSKETLLFDTKSIAYQQEQRMITTLQDKLNVINDLETTIWKKVTTITHSNKKLSFRIGYACIVLVQVLLSLYIL